MFKSFNLLANIIIINVYNDYNLYIFLIIIIYKLIMRLSKNNRIYKFKYL